MKHSVFDFKGASFSKLALSAGGLGENVLAVVTGNDRLGMTKNNSGLVASTASNVHEVRVGSLDESFELVLLLFSFEGRV